MDRPLRLTVDALAGLGSRAVGVAAAAAATAVATGVENKAADDDGEAYNLQI